jgi:hypothetical protein
VSKQLHRAGVERSLTLLLEDFVVRTDRFGRAAETKIQ